jgi:hypothetical protein
VAAGRTFGIDTGEAGRTLVVSAAELVLMAAAAFVGALVVTGIIGIKAAFLPETAFRVARAALQAVHSAILGQQDVLGRQLGRLLIDILPDCITCT